MKGKNKINIFLTIVAIPLALILAWLGVKTAAINLLGWFLALVGGVYAVGLILYFLRGSLLQGKSTEVQYEEQDDRSFWWVLPGFLVIFFLGPCEYLFLGGAARNSLALQIAGIFLMSLGFALLIWSYRVLRGYFTGHLQVMETQQLQTNGPFRFVRHPAYAGYLLIGLGVALGYSSVIGVAAFLLLMVPGFLYRIRVEERLLTAQFGDSYAQYCLHTKKIIPGIW